MVKYTVQNNGKSDVILADCRRFIRRGGVVTLEFTAALDFAIKQGMVTLLKVEDTDPPKPVKRGLRSLDDEWAT